MIVIAKIFQSRDHYIFFNFDFVPKLWRESVIYKEQSFLIFNKKSKQTKE